MADITLRGLLVRGGGLTGLLRTLVIEEGSGVTFTISETGSRATLSIAASGGGGGAPTGAQYVTLATNGSLSDERVLTAGNGVSLTDNGAGSTVVVAADVTRARMMAAISLGL